MRSLNENEVLLLRSALNALRSVSSVNACADIDDMHATIEKDRIRLVNPRPKPGEKPHRAAGPRCTCDKCRAECAERYKRSKNCIPKSLAQYNLNNH